MNHGQNRLRSRSASANAIPKLPKNHDRKSSAIVVSPQGRKRNPVGISRSRTGQSLPTTGFLEFEDPLRLSKSTSSANLGRTCSIFHLLCNFSDSSDLVSGKGSSGSIDGIESDTSSNFIESGTLREYLDLCLQSSGTSVSFSLIFFFLCHLLSSAQIRNTRRCSSSSTPNSPRPPV